ncbi:hypothetical protein NHX12_003472, partial [Muraenolepis orangiensis]
NAFNLVELQRSLQPSPARYLRYRYPRCVVSYPQTEPSPDASHRGATSIASGSSTPPSSPSRAGSRKSSMCSLLQMPSAGAHRLSSVSSHDSGFISQDANIMPSDITSQMSTSSASSEASETCHTGSPSLSLAMGLTRGLSMEQQKCSWNSLHYSSGYNTQTNTPSCSEDTLPSQGSDYKCYSLNGEADGEGHADFDKSSTIPWHSNIAQNIATICRTPSSKTGARRTPSTSGPIPIRPPIVPRKTPTAPRSMGFGRVSPASSPVAPEDPLLAANHQSLVEKIGELAASARALGEGHFPFPGSLLPGKSG